MSIRWCFDEGEGVNELYLEWAEEVDMFAGEEQDCKREKVERNG